MNRRCVGEEVVRMLDSKAMMERGEIDMEGMKR